MRPESYAPGSQSRAILIRGSGQYPLGDGRARPLNPPVRAAGILLCYVIGAFALGALLAPGLFQLAQWAAGEFPAFQSLAGQPFHRYVNRCLLLTALVGLWPLLRALNLADRRALGLTSPFAARRPLALGFALGFGSLLLVALALTFAGVRAPNSGLTAALVGKLLFTATLTAVAVALLEETLFRGVIFGALRRVWPLWAALMASAGIYSALHFFARVQHTGPVPWDAGLALLPQMARGIIAPENRLPALTLLLAGLALGLANHRTGDLWFSIGLHAGWVFWLKVFKTVTVPGAASGGAFWGTEKLLDGWLTFAVMTSVLLLVARLPQSPPEASLLDESLSRQPRS